MQSGAQSTEGGNGGGPDRSAGMVRRTKQHQTPLEFITPARTFEEALAKARLCDERKANMAVLYHSWMKTFNKRGLFNSDIEDLTHSLISLTAVGGSNLNLTAMSHVGIFFPEASGTKLDKDQRKLLGEMQKLNTERKGDQNEGENKVQ